MRPTVVYEKNLVLLLTELQVHANAQTPQKVLALRASLQAAIRLLQTSFLLDPSARSKIRLSVLASLIQLIVLLPSPPPEVMKTVIRTKLCTTAWEVDHQPT